MNESLIEKAKRLGVQPAGQAQESLTQKAQRLGIQPNATQPKVDRLQKVGETVNKIFPGKKIGEAVGTSAAALVQLLKGNVPEYKDIIDSQVSPKEVAGDVINAVSTAGSFAGVGAVGGIVKKALGSALAGAGMFGGQAASEDKGLSEVAKSAAVGAGVGAVTSGALSGAELALKQVRGIPSRLIRSATGQSKKELLAGRGLEKFVIENKKIGTAESLIAQSKQEMDKLSSLINTNLKSVPVTQAKVTTSSILDDIVRGVNNDGGAISRAEARQIVERLAPQAKGLLAKPSMSLVTANKLRQSIDKTIGDKGFLMSEVPFNKEVLRSFTNALREQVKQKAPEGTRAAFNSLSNEIRLSTALANKMAQGSRNQIISFGDLIGGGIGGAAGGIPGAMAGAAIRRGVQSTPFLTGSAIAIDSLDKALSPVLVQLEPSVQTAILTALRDAIGSSTSGENVDLSD